MMRAALIFAFVLVALASLLFVSSGEVLHQVVQGSLRELLMNPLGALTLGVVYALCFGFVVPVTTILLIVGGYVFGFEYASFFFLLATFAGIFFVNGFSHRFALLSNKLLGKRHEELVLVAKQHPWSYLLSARFAPLVPFPVVHVIPMIAKIPLVQQVLVAVIAVVPPTLVFTYLGSVIGAPDKERIAGELSLALVFVSLLVLLGVLVRHVLRKKDKLQPIPTSSSPDVR